MSVLLGHASEPGGGPDGRGSSEAVSSSVKMQIIIPFKAWMSSMSIIMHISQMSIPWVFSVMNKLLILSVGNGIACHS